MQKHKNFWRNLKFEIQKSFKIPRMHKISDFLTTFEIFWSTLLQVLNHFFDKGYLSINITKKSIIGSKIRKTLKNFWTSTAMNDFLIELVKFKSRNLQVHDHSSNFKIYFAKNLNFIAKAPRKFSILKPQKLSSISPHQ